MKIKGEMYQLDYIDKQILSLLKANARMPYSKIAESLKISNSLVHQRVRKMKDEGVIVKADLILNEKQIGYSTKSYTGIRLREAHYAHRVAEELENIPEVIECNFVSGGYALFILVYAEDNDHLHKILYEQVHKIEGVAGTDTFICFSTLFSKQIPLPN